MKVIAFITATIIGLCVLGITDAEAQSTDTSTNSILFLADSRIQQLASRQYQINRLSAYKNSAGQYKGYRVMILNTNNRTLAYKTRTDILRYFPEHNVYMAYQAPYFKLKAGDFVKREDAEKFRDDLKRIMDQSFYVISDIITLSPEAELRLLEEQDKTRRKS